MYDGTELWSSANLLADQVPQVVNISDIETDTPLSELEKALNKPLRTKSPYTLIGYESPERFEFVSSSGNTPWVHSSFVTNLL